jgi:hypothetical protein
LVDLQKFFSGKERALYLGSKEKERPRAPLSISLAMKLEGHEDNVKFHGTCSLSKDVLKEDETP